MRTTCSILAGLTLLQAAQAQIAAPSQAVDAENLANSAPATTAHEIVSRGPHHRVWERTVYESTRQGEMARIQKFTELATGMHWQETPDGPWLLTIEEILPVPGGAVARKGPHKVIFANDLATYGSIDMETPDGRRIQSHPLMLSYFDPATGMSVSIGEVQECQGRLAQRNQVVYERALTDIACTIRYTYRKAGLEQDIILLEALPAPELWGMSSDTAILEFLTEFKTDEAPGKTARILQFSQNQMLIDETIALQGMRIGPGRAFSLGVPETLPAVNVAKQYQTLDGEREFLIERVPYKHIKPHLDALPRRDAAITPEKAARHKVAALKDLVPQRRLAAKGGNKSMEVASAGAPATGLVLDYIIMATSATNMVFGAFEGFLISGPVNLAGDTVFEQGSCIKLPVSSTASIITSNVVFKGSTYAPVVFTAVHDATIGENMGSVNPMTSYYGNIALDLSSASTPQLVSNAKFCYLSNALAGTYITLQDVELVHCKNGFAPGVSLPTLRNVLAWNVNAIVAAEGDPGDVVTAENVTAHNCGSLTEDTTGTLYLTNCLFVNVTNYLCLNTFTNNCAFLTCASDHIVRGS